MELPAQGFKTTFFTDTIESNCVFQCSQKDDNYYYGGNFFDKELGYWTGFFGKVDKQGKTSLVGSEKIDSLAGFNVCNKMVADEAGLYILGSFARVNKVFHYNYALDSVYVTTKFPYKKYDLNAFGMVKNSSGDFIFTGITYISPTDQDIKAIVMKNDSVIYSYQEVDKKNQSGSSKPLLGADGKIYMVCSDFLSLVKDDNTYITCLDSTLKVVYTTKKTNNQISLNQSEGVLLDSKKNILVTGYDRIKIGDFLFDYIPKIAKFDSLGRLVWNKKFGQLNVNNTDGWGQFTNIIESQEKDGYIIIGSHNYSTENNDTLIVNAVIGKITYDGDSVWYKSYGFRDADNGTICVFSDVVATPDGGYFAAGWSINNGNSDPPGFRSILLKTDACGNITFQPCTNSIVDTKNVKTTIHVYPNPTKNEIYISHDNAKMVSICIYNNVGMLIDQFNIENKDHVAIKDVSKLISGNYTIQAKIGNILVGKTQFVKL